MSSSTGNGARHAPRSAHAAAAARARPPVARAGEDRIADFRIAHARLERGAGRPLMQLLGVSHHLPEDSTDYAVHSRLHDDRGRGRRFDSTVRVYASGHLRMVR